MKHLIYFLLFSTVVFSQNYGYSIEEARKLPATPTGLVASQITQTSVDLTWTASVVNTSVSEYKIYNKNTLLTKSVGTGTTYKLTGLTPETAYSLTVRATDNVGNISGDSNILTFTTAKLAIGVNNQPEEIAYFNAYLLPISQKANIQTALDTYGAVRLGKGDYSGVNVVMHSNQKLYGHPSITGVSNITIAAGSSNVVLEDLSPAPNKSVTITFQAGGVISNCTIKTMKFCDIQATNATIENSTFIDIIGAIRFDCSVSGYFRNNKIIKHQVQGTSNMLIMKGNSTTPSYGNVNLHSNYLTSTGVTTDISNIQSSTFIGIDCEAYGGLTRELFYAQNIGKLNMVVTQGGVQYQSPFGYANIDASGVNYLAHNGSGYASSILSPRANLFRLNSFNQTNRSTGTITGFDLTSDVNTRTLSYNGVAQTTTITDPTTITKFTNSILGTQYSPWARPSWGTLPDPLGANWKTDRVGKTDQTAYIQGLINTNGVAELPEGIFYISSTLNIPLDKSHGIVGQGTGKTVIVGLTDNFPLISLTTGDFGNFTLSNLTLQGGSVGIYANSKTMLWAYQNIKFVVFREQTYGIQFHQIFGFDNNFLDNLAFVNCTKGIFQDSLIPYVAGVLEGCSYIDKTLFYKTQFINCSTAVSMQGTRANNMDAWVDCKFDGGSQAFNGGGNSTIFANCDFTNYTGTNVITTNSLSIFSSNFYNNSVSVATLSSVSNDFEGCNFLDNSNLFAPDVNNSIIYNIINSTVTGNALITSNRPSNAMFINSKLLLNPTLSKLLVNIKAGTPTVLINATPNPYPQLLVIQ